MERETKKQKEYSEREAVDVTEMGYSAQDVAEMKHLDFMYGGETTQQELEDMRSEELDQGINPFAEQKTLKMKP